MKKVNRKAKKTAGKVAKKGKGKTGTAKKSKKETVTAKTTVPVDLVQVRKNIATLVRNSAEEIAAGVIGVAKKGQLAPAKYLFEAVGLYPATEETAAKPEHSLAYTLLKQMGLPTEPMIREEDEDPDLLGSVGDPTRREQADSDEDDPKYDGEQNPDTPDGEDLAGRLGDGRMP